MFMVASRVVDQENSGNITATADALLLVARADLFSECLVETLGKKFPLCDIISSNTHAVEKSSENRIRLVLLYRIPATELHETLQNVHMTHPGAAVALVIDAPDMVETYLNRLVEARIIDGVLPLNLRMDVFIAAVDLLMKGGEHFPSALLGRLRAGDIAAEKPVTGHHPAAASTSGTAHRNGEYVLTTREVQILDLLCKGTQNKIIAGKLHLSENTVKVHVRNIYKKMNVRNRTEAASRFFNTETGGNVQPGMRN